LVSLKTSILQSAGIHAVSIFFDGNCKMDFRFRGKDNGLPDSF